MQQQIYEYEFGSFRFRLSHHDQIVPGQLFRKNNAGVEVEVGKMKRSPTACRLLAFLLEHRGLPSENTDVIKHIWLAEGEVGEKKGLRFMSIHYGIF